MADVSTDKTRGGCGIIYAVFGKNKLWSRRSASAGAIPSSICSSKRRRNSFQEDDVPTPPNANDNVRVGGEPNKGPAPQQQMPTSQQVVNAGQLQGKKKQQQRVAKETLGISGELESIIAEHQRGGANAGLMRASSGNVMLYGHLGNLRQPAAKDEGQVPRKYGNTVMGNIFNNNNNNSNNRSVAVEMNNSLCRAISCRMDPEELKILGNEDYKNGRFAEALALYERAIDMDPSKASYRSNKSAALTALGRLLEAALECRKAIQIQPNYQRAHHRLANLYLRLGEAEKALFHFKKAGAEADPDAIAKAKLVLSHLNKCEQAKRIRDWSSVINATNNAISAGADSAPTIFGLQAEAFLMLHRHQDAVSALSNGPSFDLEQSIKLLGAAGNAALLLIRAQVDMASGRLDDAVGAAERAGQLDPSNKEVGPISRRARAVASARAHGNQLFRASKFGEAATAYSEGLEHDPYSSVLLCNRAACRSKLGLYHKAIDDCNSALRVRPSYDKARLRRADCNSKLGKWETAIQDYETLMRDSPGDEEVGRALFEAKLQLKKQHGVDNNNDFNEVIVIQSNERFRHFISLPGVAVVLFCSNPAEKRTLGFMDQLCNRYTAIMFLKVEGEELSLIAKTEGVMSFPTFFVYKNGSREKKIEGDDHELLDSCIKEYAHCIE
ncbi:hypothetical protein V2J09_016494 [Rumex salicifolius]